MQIDIVNISTLITDPENSRAHDEKNLKSIEWSIVNFGTVEPLVVRRSNNVVIGGNGRLEVFKRLGYENIPVHFVDLDDVKAKALAHALNRASELASWDLDNLKVNLEFLKENDFDLSAIGFDDEDLSIFFPEPILPGATTNEPEKYKCPTCGSLKKV